MSKVFNRIEVDLAEVYRLSALGLNKGQIADSLQMSRATFDRRREENDEINQALASGRASGIEEMAELLFRRARAGELKAVLAYLQSKGHWSTKQTLEVVDKSPQLRIIMTPQALENNSGKVFKVLNGEKDEENERGLNFNGLNVHLN